MLDEQKIQKNSWGGYSLALYADLAGIQRYARALNKINQPATVTIGKHADAIRHVIFIPESLISTISSIIGINIIHYKRRSMCSAPHEALKKNITDNLTPSSLIIIEINNSEGLDRIGILHEHSVPVIKAALPSSTFPPREDFKIILDGDPLANLHALDERQQLEAVEQRLSSDELITTRFRNADLYASRNSELIALCKAGAKNLSRVFNVNVVVNGTVHFLRDAFMFAVDNNNAQSVCIFENDPPLLVTANGGFKDNMEKVGFRFDKS